MKWITRERPKIDRIACPWLIKRFIDKDAEFFFVPFLDVIKKAAELDAVPFDIPGVEFTHYNDKCTFDYFVEKYHIEDPAIHSLAVNGRILDVIFFNKIIECAFIIVVREFNPGYVKRDCIELGGFFYYVKKGNEKKFGILINKTFNKPRTSDTINLWPFPRDPLHV